jgi:hypothetical protein
MLLPLEVVGVAHAAAAGGGWGRRGGGGRGRRRWSGAEEVVGGGAEETSGGAVARRRSPSVCSRMSRWESWPFRFCPPAPYKSCGGPLTPFGPNFAGGVCGIAKGRCHLHPESLASSWQYCSYVPANPHLQILYDYVVHLHYRIFLNMQLCHIIMSLLT